MKSVVMRIIASAFMLSGFGVLNAVAQSSVPANLQVPAGNTLFLAASAVGTQNYVCLPVKNKNDVAWKFLGPQATLFVGEGASRQQVTTHFLSTNPAEGSVARPTWQHSLDTSKVWARAFASSADPAYVAPGAIPWLLLEAVGTETEPVGGGILAQTTFIQRLNTSGGAAPATGCTDASEIGRVALVPYSTDYFFYRQSQN